MSLIINQKQYYTITEACKMAGTNRNTLLRWIREGIFIDVKIRDRNGWRLFDDDDIKRLIVKLNQGNQISTPSRH